MNRLSKFTLVAVVLVLALSCLAGPVSACPTCKDGMAGDPAYSSMVKGYFWSILFMMSMPFLVFSGVAGYFYYEIRRARKQKAAAATTGTSQRDSAAPDIALQS